MVDMSPRRAVAMVAPYAAWVHILGMCQDNGYPVETFFPLSATGADPATHGGLVVLWEPHGVQLIGQNESTLTALSAVWRVGQTSSVRQRPLLAGLLSDEGLQRIAPPG